VKKINLKNKKWKEKNKQNKDCEILFSYYFINHLLTA